jgi:hypothetical protein
MEVFIKKRVENLIKIEDFLLTGGGGVEWMNKRKLTELERDELEGDVNREELRKALDGSNFDSSSGWDGISF